MAKRELEQAAVLERIAAKKCSQKAGAKQLGITSRQVRRIQKRYRGSAPKTAKSLTG